MNLPEALAGQIDVSRETMEIIEHLQKQKKIKDIIRAAKKGQLLLT